MSVPGSSGSPVSSAGSPASRRALSICRKRSRMGASRSIFRLSTRRFLRSSCRSPLRCTSSSTWLLKARNSSSRFFAAPMSPLNSARRSAIFFDAEPRSYLLRHIAFASVSSSSMTLRAGRMRSTPTPPTSRSCTACHALSLSCKATRSYSESAYMASYTSLEMCIKGTSRLPNVSEPPPDETSSPEGVLRRRRVTVYCPPLSGSIVRLPSMRAPSRGA